jgi:hypothetical protein
MPSLADALGNFVTAITGIFTSLLSSVIAVFQSVIALAQTLVGSVLSIAQSVVALVLDLCQGVVGFVIGSSRIYLPSRRPPGLVQRSKEVMSMDLRRSCLGGRRFD